MVIPGFWSYQGHQSSSMDSENWERMGEWEWSGESQKMGWGKCWGCPITLILHPFLVGSQEMFGGDSQFLVGSQRDFGGNSWFLIRFWGKFPISDGIQEGFLVALPGFLMGSQGYSGGNS